MELDSGDVATDTNISFNVHTGTHVDAPSHFISGGRSVDELSLDTLIGACRVVELEPEVTEISADILDDLSIPPGNKRLLLKTGNSAYWVEKHNEFQENFSALTADGAQWIVDHGFELVGIDYLSIQRYSDGPETHQILLTAEVIIIEGLDLSSVVPGQYELLCLPVKLQGLEGAPARVILREIDE